MVVGLIKGGLKMSLHILNNYHFTKENILSLLSQLNIEPENPNAQSKSNFICVYNLKDELVSRYIYYYNYDSYPIIHVTNDQHEIQNVIRENCFVEILVEDLVSNNIYKIEQKYTKDSNDNLINVTNMWIE